MLKFPSSYRVKKQAIALAILSTGIAFSAASLAGTDDSSKPPQKRLPKISTAKNSTVVGSTESSVGTELPRSESKPTSKPGVRRQGQPNKPGLAKLLAEDGSTMVQSSIRGKEVGEHVHIGSNNALSMTVGTAQASMTMTNSLGNTHGLVVEDDRLVLSGGAHSTTLVLDDSGASFAHAETGAPVVVSGVAAGVSDTDAANVGQVQSAVSTAVAPIGARLDAIDGSVQRLERKIDSVERKVSGGVAMALALAQPVSFAPQARNAVAGGIASYNGQSAVGFSFNRLVTNTEQRRTVVSVGVAATTSGRATASARAGASFSW